MKKLTNQIISFILALSMVFTMNDVAFAVERSVDSEVETAYTLVQTTESAYGTVYYVKDQQGIQNHLGSCRYINGWCFVGKTF